MEKNKCPVCGTIIELKIIPAKHGLRKVIPSYKQFVCPCGDMSELMPNVRGTFCIHSGLPSIKIKCPFCDRIHYHSPEPLPALRRSHCEGWGGTYYIINNPVVEEVMDRITGDESDN